MFEAHLRGHASLERGLDRAEPFMRDPGAPGIAPLLHRDAAAGLYRYGTVPSVSLAEVLRGRSPGDPCGVRAAMTVLVSASRALQQVATGAAAVGFSSHGSLNPWRIALGVGGEVQVLGFGLPDVELLAYLDEQQSGVSADTLRYTPPERLEETTEDARSDLYTLGLIAAEMVLGRPVFDGRPDEIAERVFNGDAPALIEALGGDLGDLLLDLLCVATERKPEERFQDMREFLAQAEPLLDVKGPTIAELVARALERRQAYEADPPTDVVSKGPKPEPQASQGTGDEIDTRSDLGEFELIQPVPFLPDSASLEDLQGQARAIVERCRQLAEQGDAMQSIAIQRAAVSEDVGPIVRKLKDAVSKTHKAAGSAGNTAKLVELDDTVDDARVTLEMVRGAEKLCFSAATQALEILYRVQSDVDDMRAERQALERALRRATEARERATEASRKASETVARLTENVAKGSLSTQGATDSVATATRHSDTARDQLKRCVAAAESAAGRARSVEATRDTDRARSAADRTEAALQAIQRIAKTLDEAEVDARHAEASRLRSCVARARSAALAAVQSLERAQNAASGATIPEGSRLLSQIEQHATASDDAASACEALVQPVLDAADTRAPDELREAATEASTIAERSQSEANKASELSDRLVELAGEAAAVEAAQSKLIARAKALVEKADGLAKDLRDGWKTLEADTEEVTGRTARDALQVARKAVETLDIRLLSVRSDVEFLSSLTDLVDLEARVGRIVEMEPEIEDLASRATARCREARGAASRELEEISRRRASRAELNDAVARARGHADRCRTGVEAAWVTYQETVDALSDSTIEGAEGLRVRAYEIIDIAEFQAGEADTAAQAAGTQTEPAEARSHASTAASFEERIGSDLPEAMELLLRARNLATEETSRLNAARERTRDALEAGKGAIRAIEELRAASREVSRDWSEDPAVKLATAKLDAIGSGLDDDLTELRYAAERAAQVESADEAREMAPVAEASTRRLAALLTKAESAHATLEAAVRTARAEAETREAALRAASTGLASIEGHRATIAERSARLSAAVDLHQATSEEVGEAAERMRTALTEVSSAETQAVAASDGVRGAATASEARRYHEAVDVAVELAEHALQEAAAAESAGTSGAEREAAERRNAEARQLEHARSSALEHVNTAKIAAEKGVGLLSEANPELLEYDDPEVQRLHDKATNWVRVARTAATGALKAARECQRAKRASAAVEWEQRAANLASDANSAVGEASTLLREAVDLARRAEKEASALKNVKAEIASIQTMVSEGIQQAEADAARIKEITAESTDSDTLACNEEADGLVASVRRASAKIEAAAPLALQAESLDVAQGLLQTCRHALERADESADAVRELIQRSSNLLSEEEERAAQRLAEARAEAERPSENAKAASESTASLLQIGNQLMGELEHRPPAVESHLADLELASLEAHQFAEQADAAAQPARRANTLEDAKEIGNAVRAIADRAEEASERGRAALEGMRAALEAAVDDAKAAGALQITAAEEAAAAEVIAGEATSLAEALERDLSESGITDDDAARSFREVKRAAKAVAAAATSAFEQTEIALGQSALSEVTGTLETIRASRTEAEAQLAELRAQDRACRDTIDTVQRKSREDAKRKKDEALRAKLRKKRSESKAIERDELRKRFQERENREKPNLSALRERLRARRRGDQAGPGRLERRPPARPDRDTDTPAPPRARRRPAPDEASSTEVDQMLPGDETLEPQTLDPSGGRSEVEREQSRARRAERRRQRLGRPENASPTLDSHTDSGLIVPGDPDSTNAGSESADALLRRLRRNRKGDP